MPTLPPRKKKVPSKAPNAAYGEPGGPSTGGGSSWRARAQRAVAAESAPSWSLDLRSVQDDVEERRSRAVMDLATRVAELTLATGASAADVTATVLRLTDAYGLRSVHVDVTFTAIAISHHRGAEDPVTMVRTVRVRSVDYERLARLQAFVADLEANPVDIVDARSRFDAIAARPHVYRRSVVTAGSAFLGAAVALLFDGSFTEILIAFLNAVLVDRVQLLLARARLAAFFSQMIGGAIPTVVAVLLIIARSHQVPGLEEVTPSAVVAAGIVSLLAGMSVVGSAQDAIDGYYVTAGARTYEVVVLTLGITVGVVIVLGIAQRLGAPTYLAPYSALTGSLPRQLVASAIIAAGFAVTSYAGPVTAIVSVVCGTLGWGAFALAEAFDLGVVAASGAAALFIGVISQLLAGTVHVPALALSTAGIVPLLPGGAVYRGLYQLTTLSWAQGTGPGVVTLGSAAAIGLALAAGVSLGTYLGRPLRPDVARSRSRAVQRALRRGHADGRE
ncbi:threonine/serine ThrE exporter family protein [Agilicoccus flavus]|uniref:threonine/serine ThrE exporter family protein n=1 Tax=Agilicoccus flavus TaxID=2775968 RepID=UPI001CF6C779|nr:threonine/serine exporter family protein [Agilicoccus flavus]